MNEILELFNFITIFFILLIIPIFAYAEIHFRFPFVPSLLYRKEPEIIFDLPLRGLSSQPVPLFLFIKDAQKFPIQTKQVTVYITRNNQTTLFKRELDILVKEKFLSKIIKLPPKLFPEPGMYYIFARLEYKNSQKNVKIITQDNYLTIPHPPFQIYIANETLPKTEGWLWGDLHVHSNYTDDPVEFGAPIYETALAAQAIGLDFLAITDHSYDLDDDPNNFLKNSDNFIKWDQQKKEITNIQKSLKNFTLISGEEVSVGNNNNENVHCLILNDTKFHPGKGDSGEDLRNNKPTFTIPELLKQKSPNTLAIAAHPWEQPPISQKVVLRRGSWSLIDCMHPYLTGLQVINGRKKINLNIVLKDWIKLLQQGYRLSLLAGNDAHGNFNCYRQIKIPFFKMTLSRNHQLGYYRTGVFSTDCSPQNIISSIQKGRTIISNGPFAIIRLINKEISEIGDTVVRTDSSKLKIITKCISEYGHWEKISLFFGHRKQKRETKKYIQFNSNKLNLDLEIPLPNFEFDYLRMEAITKKNREIKFCLTNPIWIESQKD
jgi:hypothetical protein